MLVGKAVDGFVARKCIGGIYGDHWDKLDVTSSDPSQIMLRQGEI